MERVPPAKQVTVEATKHKTSPYMNDFIGLFRRKHVSVHAKLSSQWPRCRTPWGWDALWNRRPDPPERDDCQGRQSAPNTEAWNVRNSRTRINTFGVISQDRPKLQDCKSTSNGMSVCGLLAITHSANWHSESVKMRTNDERYWPVVLDMVLHVVEGDALVQRDVIRACLDGGSPVYIWI